MRTTNPQAVQDKKEAIVEISKQMIVEEGIASFSMRKLALKLQQTPGNIYHYFQNKEEILHCIFQHEYQNIVQVITKNTSTDVVVQVRNTLHDYILLMSNNSVLFQIFQSLDDSQITSQMRLLQPVLSKERTSISLLCECLTHGVQEGKFTISNIELRAQLIIVTALGLAKQLALEKVANKEPIIEEYITMILITLQGGKS